MQVVWTKFSQVGVTYLAKFGFLTVYFLGAAGVHFSFSLSQFQPSWVPTPSAEMGPTEVVGELGARAATHHSQLSGGPRCPAAGSRLPGDSTRPVGSAVVVPSLLPPPSAPLPRDRFW